MMARQRTVQDFVEDMVSDCRSLAEIRMIALCTRWKDRREEVEKEYRELRARRKRISKQNRKDRK